MSFGHRPCYSRYMDSLGYAISCRPNGGIVVKGIDGKEINRSEFVSFTTYCRVWKKDYPQLKVSKPIEDICQYCFVFANRHRYLANHSAAMNVVCAEYDDDGDEINVVRSLIVENNDTPGQQHNAIDANNELAMMRTRAMEVWKALLLDAAEHVRHRDCSIKQRVRRRLRMQRQASHMERGHTHLLSIMVRTWSCQFTIHSSLAAHTIIVH